MSSPQLRLRAGVVSQVIDGDMLLLDTLGGQYYDLNPSGTLLLQQLLDGASTEAAIAAVVARFDTDGGRVATDLAALLQALRSARLIDEIQPA